MANAQLPPNKIGFSLDGKVLDVFHTDDRLAAILLSEPVIFDASEYYVEKEDGFNIVGWDFDGKTATPPVEVIAVDEGIHPVQ